MTYNLLEQIEDDYKTAFKSRNEFEVGILRVLRATLKNAEIAKRPTPLTDEDVLKTIKSEVKKLNDALLDFEKANRTDLTEKTKKEVTFLKKYLPEEMSEEEVEKIVRRVIDAMKPSGSRDFGKIMGAIMKETGGRAGGDMVSRIIKRLLT